MIAQMRVPSRNWFLQKHKNPYLNFLKRFWCLGKIELKDYDRELGKHFGYPKCCVDNYISFSERGERVGEKMNEIYGKDKQVGYVRCPNCRENKKKF